MKKFFGDFFEEKKVLITGHTGFIGSWLAICLNELGAKVTGYSLPPYTKDDNFVVTNLQEKLMNNFGDIRDFDNLLKVFRTAQPDIIYHLAAQPIVRKSYSIPKETYDINVGGTVNIFEIFRKLDSTKILLNFTTDKCYENQEKSARYKETDRVGGYDPYSSSKACSELITSTYHRSFFSSKNKKFVSSIRSGNVIGGGDWQEDRLIPDCMVSMRNNEPINIRNPEYVRPWQYVLEPIRGMLTLTKKMWNEGTKYSWAWNFGPKENSIFSVRDIVEKIINYIEKGSYNVVKKQEDSILHETKLLLLDSTKAEKELGWITILNIDETIKLVCDWYMAEEINYEFDVNQIKYYFNKLN